MKKFPLKTWIFLFFGTGVTVLYSFVKFVGGEPEYFITITLGFVSYLAMYYFVLKEEFEKMQKEYEQAGSLKKTIKKWKEGGTE